MTPLHWITGIRFRHPMAIVITALWIGFGVLVWGATTWRNTHDANNNNAAVIASVLVGLPALGVSVFSLWSYEERVIAKRGPQTKQELHEEIKRLEDELGMR